MNQPTKQSIQQSTDPSKLYTWMSNPNKQTEFPKCSIVSRAQLQKMFISLSIHCSKQENLFKIRYGNVYDSVEKSLWWNESKSRTRLYLDGTNIDNICPSRRWINSHGNILSKISLTDTGAHWSKWNSTTRSVIEDINWYQWVPNMTYNCHGQWYAPMIDNSTHW